MENVMDVYINFTKKKVKKYMKMIFVKYYNDEIVNEFLQTYVNARYYNIVHSDKPARAFYLRIVNELKYKEQILLQRMTDLEDTSIINYTREIFDYVLFFDNVRKAENVKSLNSIRQIVKNIAIMRKKWFNIKGTAEFEDELYHEINDDMIKKDVFLDNFDNDDFNLNFTNHDTIEDLYYVKLENNIRMPIQYSNFAVEKVFDSGIISENKLRIEYIMLSIMAVRDILNGNFNDIYIAEFNTVLLKKKFKLENVLSIIKNQALQEKINLNIMYEDYIKYKNQILKLVNNGYNFAITLDGSVKSVSEVEKLQMFKIVILPEKIALYKEIKKAKISNVIEQ